MRKATVDTNIKRRAVIKAGQHVNISLHGCHTLGRHPGLLLRCQKPRQHLLCWLIGRDRRRKKRLYNRCHQRGIGQLVKLARDLQRGRHRRDAAMRARQPVKDVDDARPPCPVARRYIVFNIVLEQILTNCPVPHGHSICVCVDPVDQPVHAFGFARQPVRWQQTHLGAVAVPRPAPKRQLGEDFASDQPGAKRRSLHLPKGAQALNIAFLRIARPQLKPPLNGFRPLRCCDARHAECFVFGDRLEPQPGPDRVGHGLINGASQPAIVVQKIAHTGRGIIPRISDIVLGLAQCWLPAGKCHPPPPAHILPRRP